MPSVVRSPTHYPGPRPHRGRLVPTLRFLAGMPYDGHPKTNATWRKPGTGHYDPDQAGWWESQSYRRRMGIIWTVLLAPVVSVIGFIVMPEATLAAQREAAWLASLAVLWVTVHRTRRWQPYKQYLEPVHLAVHQDLGVPRKLSPRAYITLPRDGSHLTDPDRPVTVTLPDTFDWPDGPRRAKFAAKIAESSGIGPEFSAYFQLEMEPRTVTVACNPQPPTLVHFDSEVVRSWEDAKPDELVFGMSHLDKTPVKASLSGDAPMVLASIGSGGGKTELASSLCLQRRFKVGARVIYFDFIKRGASARWAKDVPGIEVVRHVDVAYRRLIELYEEIQLRCEGYWHYGDDDSQQEIFIVLDEANRSFDKLRRYDKLMQVDDKHAPSAVDAYEGILQVGREARTHMVVFGQRGSARGTGGGDARDAFGIILASRYRPNTAKMLFPEVDVPPRAPTHPGRFQVVVGGKAQEAQGVLMRDPKTKNLLEEPRRFALETPCGAPVALAPEPVPELPEADERGDEVVEGELIDPKTVASEWVDLRTAADRLRHRWPNITLAALRNYRGKQESRDEFPKPQDERAATYLYDLAEIDRFLANRPQRKGD